MGKSYTKEVEVKNKWVLMSIITIVGIFLIYLTLSFGGVVPNNYNLADYITGSNKNTSNSGEQTHINVTNPNTVLMVYGIPKEVNVSNTPHTSWQISIEVQKGEVNNLSVIMMYQPMSNVTVSYSSVDSHWIINGITAKYTGTVVQGQIITLTLNINAVGNINSGEVGNINFMIKSSNSGVVQINAQTLQVSLTS